MSSGATAKAVTTLSPHDFCYIIDLDCPTDNNVQNRVEFQLMPESIGESKSANYDQIPILGRSLPYLGYAHSGARMCSLQMSFHALGSDWTPVWVLAQVRFLESLAYPDYVAGITYPPHRVMLIIGEAIGMTCVVTNVTTNWTGPWAITDASEAYSHHADVSVDFMEWGENEDTYGHPHGWTDAVSLGGNSVNNTMGITRQGGDGLIQLPIWMPSTG